MSRMAPDLYGLDVQIDSLKDRHDDVQSRYEPDRRGGYGI